MLGTRTAASSNPVGLKRNYVTRMKTILRNAIVMTLAAFGLAVHGNAVMFATPVPDAGPTAILLGVAALALWALNRVRK